MREKYKAFYDDATRHYADIMTDKMTIERGVKEKSCFKPVIDAIHLALLIGILKSYLAQLEKVIAILEESEGAGNGDS